MRREYLFRQIECAACLCFDMCCMFCIERSPKKRADGRIDKSSLPFSLSLDTDFFINVI